jgi:FlaA1/EpsC-like NDP-sugar epimerase
MSSGVVSSVDAALSPPLEAATALRGSLEATTARTRAFHAQVPMWLVDAALLIGAGAIVAALSNDHAARTMIWSLAFAFVVIVSLSNHGLYRPWIGSRLLDTTRAIVTATAVATAAVTSIHVFVDAPTALAHRGLRLWVLGTVLLLAARSYEALMAWRRPRTRSEGAPTLIIGAGKVGQAVAKRLSASPQYGLKPVGFLDKEPVERAPGDQYLPVLGASWDVDEVIAEHNVRHVIVAFSTAPTDVLIRLLERCEQLGARISYVPRLFEMATDRFAVDHLGGLPLISPWASNPRGFGFRAKYVFDKIGAAI